MGLRESIQAALTQLGDNKKTKQDFTRALRICDVLTEKECRNFKDLAVKLSAFVEEYERGAQEFWSGKNVEHVAALKASLTAYNEQTKLQEAYTKARNQLDLQVLTYEKKLAPFYQRLNTIVDTVTNGLIVVDEESTNALANIQINLQVYVDRYLQLLLANASSSEDLQLGKLKQDLTTNFLKLNYQQTDALLQQLHQACTENLTLLQEKNMGISQADEAVKTTLINWAKGYKSSPMTWIDWEDIVVDTLLLTSDKEKRSPLRKLRKEITENMRTELEVASVRAMEASALSGMFNAKAAEIYKLESSGTEYKRKIGELSHTESEYKRKIEELEEQVDSKSHVSGSSRYSRGSIGGGDNLRLSGEEIDPMDDFRRLARFWHPSKIMMLNAFAIQLRELNPIDQTKAADESITELQASLSGMSAPLFALTVRLIKEEIRMHEALSMFMQLPNVKKSHAYAMIMGDTHQGLITLSEDLPDPQPGLGGNVNSEEEAFFRAEKLSTISEALKDNGGWSMLPCNEALAEEYAALVRGLKIQYPRIADADFKRKCMFREITKGANEYKQFYKAFTLRQQNQQDVDLSEKKETNNAGNHNAANHNDKNGSPKRMKVAADDGNDHENNNNNNNNDKNIFPKKKIAWTTPTRGATDAMNRVDLNEKKEVVKQTVLNFQ